MSQQIPNKVPIFFSFPVCPSTPLFSVAPFDVDCSHRPLRIEMRTETTRRLGATPAVTDCGDGINLCAINTYIRPCLRPPTNRHGGWRGFCDMHGARQEGEELRQLCTPR